MKNIFGLIGMMVALVGYGAVVEAQQSAKKEPRIGFLGASSAAFYSARIETFRARVIEFVAKNQLPAIFTNPEAVELKAVTIPQNVCARADKVIR
jgi:hypothetical protein